MLPTYLWILILFFILGGGVIGAVFYMSWAEGRKREKIEGAAEPVKTAYGLFRLRWVGPAEEVIWEVDEVAALSEVSLSVPDKNGEPSTEHLARVPLILDSLAILIARASASTGYPEHVSEENLVSIALKSPTDDGADLTLSFSSGDDGDMSVFVDFCGEKLIGELGID